MSYNPLQPDCLIKRSQKELLTDKAMIRELCKLAAAVELFTIPLYMTSLYSITGREVLTDGSVFPSMKPSENFALQGLPSQRAYNAIYSVYIQEMLHLQLALNIGNVIGAKAELTQPLYCLLYTSPSPRD